MYVPSMQQSTTLFIYVKINTYLSRRITVPNKNRGEDMRLGWTNNTEAVSAHCHPLKLYLNMETQHKRKSINRGTCIKTRMCDYRVTIQSEINTDSESPLTKNSLPWDI